MFARPTTWCCLACGTRFPVHTSWCSACGAAGLVVIQGERPQASIDGLAEIATARDLVSRNWKRVELAAYPVRLNAGALVVVHGGEGAGKSTWCVRALDSVRGPVLYVAAEEGCGPTTGERLVRCAATRQDLFVVGRATVDQVATFAHEQKCVALAIDSVSVASFNARDLRHLLAVLPHLRVLVATAQHNKSGEVLGERELLHEADVTIACAAMTWHVEKSRYEQAPTEPRPILDLHHGPAHPEAA